MLDIIESMSLDGAVKTLIAHKDPLARAYLRGVIERALDMHGCVEADSFSSVVDALMHYEDTRLAIVDIDLPGMASDLGLRFLGSRYREPRFAVLFTSLSEVRMERLTGEGIAGFVPKSLPEPALAGAFRMIWDGKPYRQLAGGTPAEQARSFGGSQHGFWDHELTDRQAEVLRMLALGHTNREIAQLLNIAEGTVKVHVNAAFRVLGVHNRVSAAAAMVRRLEDHERADGTNE